jgi:hypothetical protein
MVDAATRFAAEFTDAARSHDRDGSFAATHLDKLRSDGYLVAPIPAELGGGGVASTHDVLVASSRLARGDAATHDRRQHAPRHDPQPRHRLAPSRRPLGRARFESRLGTPSTRRR